MTSEPIESLQFRDKEAARRQEFLREHNPSDILQYYLLKERQLMSGQMTWMVMDFDDPYDRVHELAYKGEYIGRIEQHGMDLLGIFHSSGSETSNVYAGPDSFFTLVDALEAHAKVQYGEISTPA